MVKGIKLRPSQPIRRFLGIDVTRAIDTVAWGHLWNATFGWRNLLWELDRDPKDKQRRIDRAHADLPIARLVRKQSGNTFADTCIMPEGVDATGVDKLWPGPDSFANDTQMRNACGFMQSFILGPGVDKAASSLNDTATGAVADVIYISSHGGSSGHMVGELGHYIFETARAASTGAQFNGPGWVLLSNCNTLKPQTHGDWLTLMTGPRPLRGVVGFQDLCPTAEGSVGLFKTFIDQLAAGRTLRRAWETAVTRHTNPERWVVLCHDNAKDDKIALWNADSLTPIPPGSQVLMFDKDHAQGQPITPPTDPFEAFWSKGGTRLTVTNRSDLANLLKQGDNVSITVRPPGGGTFRAGATVSITVIYVRLDYPFFAVDVGKIFSVTAHPGASAVSTAHLNTQGPGPANPDSWQLTVVGTPSEVGLQLTCLDLTHAHPGHWLWLRVDADGTQHDFIRNAMIVIR